MQTAKKLKAAFLICPGYFVTDICDAHAIIGIQPDTEVHLVWKNRKPVIGHPNYPTIPTKTFEDCPDDLDILAVGMIPKEIMYDEEVINFFKKHAENGCYLMGICGGDLLLGAAGLLKGKHATSNFHCTEYLEKFGAIPVNTSEVVVDGKLYTTGPSHGCMEAALMLISELRGRETAELAELTLEYEPHPPFKCGSPNTATKEQVAIVNGILGEIFDDIIDAAHETFLKLNG